ncbi:MAG: hypothetical protein CMF52_08210 [Legionellales bacterium]|nr:hypothetical protein [Legionellales bacterium]
MLIGRQIRATTYHDPCPITQAASRHHSLFQHEGLARQMLISLKYNHALWTVPILGDMLVEAMRVTGDDQALVMPIPMHWRRRAQQGYNPPGLLARWVARSLRVPMRARTLVRLQHKPPQQSLSREERLSNMVGCFALRGRLPRKVTVIDDVYTTGATLREAVATLNRDNIEVSAWVITQTDVSTVPST